MIIELLKILLTGLAVIAGVLLVFVGGGWLFVNYIEVIWPYVVGVVVIGFALNIGHEIRREL